MPADAVDHLRTFLHDTFASFQDWLTSLTVLEWVLLGIAAAILLWVVAQVRAATTLGPIAVATVEDENGGDATLHGITAQLRERINDVGFRPPPNVPGGAPETNLLSAVEKSPIPQANWIASLIQAVPRPQPMSYTLSTVRLSRGRGVAFWLRPDGAGAPLMGTAPGWSGAALKGVARRVLMHVSRDAVDIFPPWTRWDDEAALKAYLEGIDAADQERYSEAQVCLESAASAEPDNAVARLRLLNCREASARAAELVPDPPGADRLARILRDYLALAIQRPELVEARYRASTLAAIVADRFSTVDADDDVWPTALHMSLRDIRWIGRHGLDLALAQLQPWFVPLAWHRPRYAVEPRGRERRRLKRTLEISKRCQFARRHRAEGDWWTKLRRRWWTTLVRARANRSNADWQVHYNAGCFFALIEKPVEAFRYLNRALDGGGYGKVVSWMQNDPDLALLQGTDAWTRLIKRTGTTNQRAVSDELRSVVSSFAAALAGIGAAVFLLAVSWAWWVTLLCIVARTAGIFVAYLVRERKLLKLGERLPA